MLKRSAPLSFFVVRELDEDEEDEHEDEDEDWDSVGEEDGVADAFAANWYRPFLLRKSY